MFETIPYLEWIDGRIESARYDLASSNLCTSRNGIVSESDIYSAADVSELIADEYGVRPENVLLTAGTGHANFVVAATIATMCEHRSDKMDYLVETPSYQPLIRTPRSLGANVARFERRATNEYRLNLTTIEDTISPATDIIVVTNRHNPSGQLTDVNKLAALAELASDKDTLLLIDEAYAPYGRSPTEGPFGGPSAAGFSDTIVISSITKFFNLYDLRIGWIIAEEAFINRARSVMYHSDVVSRLCARYAATAIDNSKSLGDQSRKLIDENYSKLTAFRKTRTDLTGDVLDGSTFAFLQHCRVDGDSVAQEAWKEGILVVPGRFFGDPDRFRISVGAPPSEVKTALTMLADVLDRL